MRVLLSDGSGLTARQVTSQLAKAGHTVEVLTPDRLALTRFTHHKTALHRVPAYGVDPLRWLDAALAVLSSARPRFDVLLPTQEQAAILSLFDDRVCPLGGWAGRPAIRVAGPGPGQARGDRDADTTRSSDAGISHRSHTRTINR